MCGIFCCLSKKQPQNLITKTLTGLKILEYRGYDSAGIAYQQQEKIHIAKSVGGIEKLATKVDPKVTTTICLGHTRWATNGKVSINNSHPHLSKNGQIAVVHNGIIENYHECCEYLRQAQIKLQTPVDTEVIPNILYLLKHNKHNIHDFLQGQYVFCAGYFGTSPSFFLAKKGTLPLYIAKDNDNFYVTSDTLALPPSTTHTIALVDHDTCEISGTTIKFYNRGQIVKRSWQVFNQSFTASNKNGFTTYMEKEINEIPQVLARIAQVYQSDQTIIRNREKLHKIFQNAHCIHVCGCGTSYHAALIIAALLESQLHIRAKAHISSELAATTLLNEPAVAIIISQSGETADTLSAMSILQAAKIPMISLCNVASSTIAKQCQINFPLLCGPEIAVASTKVFCAAIFVACMLINRYATTSCNDLSEIATNILKNSRQLLPQPNKRPKMIFFIGKGLNYYLALEAALKVKEVTYTHCEGYPANELKHGPLAMIDENSLAIVYQGDTENAVAEIKARGGQVICLPPAAPTNPLAFIAQIIPAQIFALDLARQRNIDPDKPRNLAKSVTVL